MRNVEKLVWRAVYEEKINGGIHVTRVDDGARQQQNQQQQQQHAISMPLQEFRGFHEEQKIPQHIKCDYNLSEIVSKFQHNKI